MSLVTYGIEQSVYRSMEREKKRSQYYADPYSSLNTGIGEGIGGTSGIQHQYDRSVYGNNQQQQQQQNRGTSSDSLSNDSWQRDDDGFVRILLSSNGSDMFPTPTVANVNTTLTSHITNLLSGKPSIRPEDETLLQQQQQQQTAVPPSLQPSQGTNPNSLHHHASIRHSLHNQHYHAHGHSMTATGGNSTMFSSVVHQLLTAVGAYVPGEYGVDPITHSHAAFRPYTDRQSDSSMSSTTSSSNNSVTFHSPMIYKTSYPFMEQNKPNAATFNQSNAKYSSHCNSNIFTTKY